MTAKIAERSTTNHAPAIRAPGFVGREHELAALAHVLAGPPAVVLIEGEAGIGKTRLVREFLASEPGQAFPALVACCPAFHQPQTLGPIVDAVRQVAGERINDLRLSQLAGALRPLLPEWADDLPPSVEPLADATASRHRIFRALAELLGCLRVTRLVVEDAHWADEPTLEFLLFLASQQPWHVSLVVTYRPEDVPTTSLILRLARLAGGTTGSRLVLEPLDIEATAHMVSSMIGDEPVSEEFASFLHNHTDGLPLAVEETVRLMRDRADLTVRHGRWARHHLGDLTVPPTVRDAVLERAARLPAEAQAVLRAAAVHTDPTDESTMLSVSGLATSQFRTGLLGALNCGLISADRSGLVQFRHALAARAVYEAIPVPERREMHRRAGRSLEGATPQPLTQLVRHFREAGETASWCHYGERAADLAFAAGDETTAAALLHELVTHGGLPSADVVRLTDKIPLLVLEGSGRLEELARALRCVLDAGRAEGDQRADLRCQLGRVLTEMGDWNAAHSELEQAVPHLAHDPVAMARTMILLGFPLGTDRPAAHHRQWLRRAAAVVTAAGSRDRLLMLVNSTTNLLLLGEEEGWAEAARIPADVPSARERWEAARGHANLAEMANLWGRYPQARQHVTHARRLTESHEYASLRSQAEVEEVRLDWFTGAWDGLVDRAEALACAVDADIPRSLRLQARLVMALLEVARGARTQAEEHLERVLQEIRQAAAPEYCIEPAAALAKLLVARGAVSDALQVTDELSGMVARRGIWIWSADLAPARVTALLGAGRHDQAADFTRRLAGGLNVCNAPAPNAAVMLCRAMLAESSGQHRPAATLFARAAGLWGALQRPYDTLLARERQALSLIACDQVHIATALLEDVRQHLIALGAMGDADRVVSTLRAHGVAARRPQRGGWIAYGGELSPRELEVARLVMAGHTNREIANALCRSPKTVAAQLNSAMRKLGVSSRTALAVRMMEARDNEDLHRRG